MEDLRLRDPTFHRLPPPRLGVCGEENTRRHQWVQVKKEFQQVYDGPYPLTYLQQQNQKIYHYHRLIMIFFQIQVCLA